MKRIIKKAGGIFRALFALLMIYLIIFFITQGMNTPVRYDGEFDIQGGGFGKNPTYLGDAANTDADIIYSQMDEFDPNSVLDTAYSLYELSLKRLALVPGYGSRISGTIQFSALSVDGTVKTTQFRNIEKIGTPILAATQPYKMQYQNVIMMQDMVGATMIKNSLESVINKGVRDYSDGQNVWSQEGSSPYMDTLGGGANWSAEPSMKSLAEYNTGKRQYTPDQLREKSNYIINPDTIVGDSIEIINRVSGGVNCYDISFDLDCTSTDEGSAVYYEANSITGIVGDNLKLVYTMANVSMTIYANGYMTNWHTYSEWTAIFSLGKALSLSGTAKMSSDEAISYDVSETAVVDYRTERK